MARTVIARVAVAGVVATVIGLAGIGPVAGHLAFAGAALAAARDGGSSLRGDGSPSAPTWAVRPGWVKYYIVPPPAGGATQSLQQIALMTMGSSGYAGQILLDNLGRIQPDGGRLTSPGALRPGWILVLPAAAQGPGVIYGPLPVVTPLPVSSAKVPSVPKATAVAPATGPAGRRRKPAGTSWAVIAEAASAAALAAIALGIGAALLRRRRLIAGASPPPGLETDALASHDPAVPARELVTAGTAGTAWLEPTPDGWGDDDGMPPGYPAPARRAWPAQAQPAGAGAWEAGGPVAPGGAGRGFHGHDQGDGPGRPRHAAQARLQGRHRRRRGKGVPPDMEQAPGPEVAWEEAPEHTESRLLAGELEPLPEFPRQAGNLDRHAGTLDEQFGTLDEQFGYRARIGSIADAPTAATPADAPAATPADAPAATPADAPAATPADAPAATHVDPPAATPADAPTATDTRGRGPGEVRSGAARPAGPPPDGKSQTRPPQDEKKTQKKEKQEPGPEPEFSPAALHLLGVAQGKRGGDGTDGPAQRHQVMFGDDKVDVVLAQGPAAGHNGKRRNGKAWLATAPYLAWAPLPYETPDGGVAFASLGAGDEGCLFIDLAAAPGAIAIRGDRDAAAHLAESLAHQLCRQGADDSSCTVVLVGDVVPEPRPPRAVLAPTLHDLGIVNDAAAPETEIVFCTLRANEDAFVLARHVSRSAHRVVPVVLADLPGAPWSFSVTAQPALDLDARG
jgi:hypothetical protein